MAHLDQPVGMTVDTGTAGSTDREKVASLINILNGEEPCTNCGKTHIAAESLLNGVDHKIIVLELAVGYLKDLIKRNDAVGDDFLRDAHGKRTQDIEAVGLQMLIEGIMVGLWMAVHIDEASNAEIMAELNAVASVDKIKAVNEFMETFAAEHFEESEEPNSV